ncbi:hypothetical protein [Lutibacter sp.]|jgi:hypothetical protein|nr:hypothetical protein [Lutibacter sp.]
MDNRFKKRKKPNYKRGIILVLALFLILYLWLNAETIITALFHKQ